MMFMVAKCYVVSRSTVTLKVNCSAIGRAVKIKHPSFDREIIDSILSPFISLAMWSGMHSYMWHA